MKNQSFLLVCILVLSSINVSFAQTNESVCLRKRARVVNGRINLARAVKRVEGECPKNTVPLDDATDTSSLGANLDPEFKSLLQNGFVVTNEKFLLFREDAATIGIQANCPDSSILLGGSCTYPESDVSLTGSSPFFPSNDTSASTWLCNYFASVPPGQVIARSYTAKAICLTVTD